MNPAVEEQDVAQVLIDIVSQHLTPRNGKLIRLLVHHYGHGLQFRDQDSLMALADACDGGAQPVAEAGKP